MMHIFTIHSPLTFLVAYATIRHLGLPEEEVILVSQKYRVPLEIGKVVPSFQDQYRSLWQKFRTGNVPAHHDRFIDDLTGGQPFTAYVELMGYYQKILVTHAMCKTFHFIEEGNSAYMATDDLADLTWEDYTGGMSFRLHSFFSKASLRSLMRVLRGYNLRLISLPYHYMAYQNFPDIRFFAFSENAFYNLPPGKRTLLSLQANDPHVRQWAGDIELKEAVIWIDGANGRYTGATEKEYGHAIHQAIPILKQRGVLDEVVYVKLRPGLRDAGSNLLVSTLRNTGLEVKVLPGDLILEALFCVSTNCHVIGVLTAALEYAHVFGHQAWSIYGLFDNQPPTFLDRMDGFWRNVKKLTTQLDQ